VTQHGLIFDLDGTLVDSLPGIAASLNRALVCSHLPPHALDAVRGFIGNGARVLVSRAAPVGTDAPRLEELEQAFKADYNLTWAQGTAPYPGVAGLLAELQRRGIPLAVFSNKPHPFTTAMVSASFPDVSFAAVLGQRAEIPLKPDPAGALDIAATLDLPPQNCTMIGDSTMDIATARHAGMRAVAVTWGYHDREALQATRPDAMIDTPAGLFELLDQAPATVPKAEKRC
jgi:phosphoglycolate phosphatase